MLLLQSTDEELFVICYFDYYC